MWFNKEGSGVEQREDEVHGPGASNDGTVDGLVKRYDFGMFYRASFGFFIAYQAKSHQY